jgi:CRP-like cAMP-binding protein
MEDFFLKINDYTQLSKEARVAWLNILNRRKYAKGSFLIMSGELGKNVHFVSQGLFSQYAISSNGEVAIKRFFSEGYFAASITSILSQSPSATTIEALEDSIVYEYDFAAFKELTQRYKEVADFYIHYIEKHWIVEKEPDEISFRQDTSKTRYDDFIKKYPHLIKRIKKHQIAAYLGITPTQMSRIFFANK